MEDLPCVGLDGLKDAAFRKKCADAAKSLSSKKWWAAIILCPFIAFGALASFGILLAMLGLEGAIVGGVSGALSGLLGKGASEGIAGVAASIVFWAFEIALFASGILFTMAALAIIYYPLKSSLIRDAYVSRRIMLAKDPEEAKQVALPYIAVFRVYLFFMGLAGRADNLKSGDASYSKGAVVLKTPAFTFAYGSDYRIRMRASRRYGDKAYDEWKMEGVEVRVADSTEHTAFIFRDALAVVEKKHKDAVVSAIRRVDPDALGKKKG